MKTTKITLFKVNGETVCEVRKPLNKKELDEMTWDVAAEIEVPIYDVKVDYIEVPEDLSDIDLTPDGLLDWKDTLNNIIYGVRLTIDVGSDLYMDAVANNTIDEYIEFLK